MPIENVLKYAIISDTMKAQNNTAKAIRSAVARTPAGEPFVTHRFRTHGGQAAVQKALSRLVQEGVVRRVAQGIFVKPEKSPYVQGEVAPDLARVIQAVAKRTGSEVQMNGAEAAMRMGLSTQVPLQPIFETSGPSRFVKIGPNKVKLKHVSARKLALAGQPAGVALAALWYLGKDEVASKTFAGIARRLGQEQFNTLSKARHNMPGWMLKALETYEAERELG